MKTCLGSQTLVMTVVLVQVFMMERAETFGWPWRWSPSLSSEDGKVGHRHKRAEAGGAASRQRRAERLGRVTFETVREDSYKIHSSLMEQAQQIALRNEGSEYALEASCWSTAYRKLFSSCKEILRDEEKKSRLAFELTRCFLIMNGWPSPPPCPDSKPIKSCTEKIDKSTLETYLVFFQDSAATCYHLQSEAFREETDKMINDLKNSGHLILEKVKDVDELSREILGDTFEQSELIFEKLKNVEDHSAKLLQHHNVVEGLLNTTRDTLEAVYKGSDEILQMQMDLKSMHNDMNATLMEGFNKLDEAAQSTYEHLQGISQVQEEIGHQQVRLADTLSENILHLKDTALESMEELKLSQAMVMEETRSSLKGLSQNVRTAQLEFELWTTELDSKSQAILSGSEEMLKAQELFVNKQNSIMGTLDRLFSLYDITLYESRAFKLFIFYSLSLVFLHFMTSAKQTNSARPLLYPALCISMGTELYLSRAYGSIFDNQQWLQNKCYWIRAVFAVFSAFTIGFFFLTYRDINWKNHELLLEILQMLCKVESQNLKADVSHDCYLNKGKDISYPLPKMISVQTKHLITMPCSWKQSQTSKIIRRAHKFIRRGIKRMPIFKQTRQYDALICWMASRGMDLSSLDECSSSDDSDEDPDFECPQVGCWAIASNQRRQYFLRSQCDNRCRQRTNWRLCP